MSCHCRIDELLDQVDAGSQVVATDQLDIVEDVATPRRDSEVTAWVRRCAIVAATLCTSNVFLHCRLQYTPSEYCLRSYLRWLHAAQQSLLEDTLRNYNSKRCR